MNSRDLRGTMGNSGELWNNLIYLRLRDIVTTSSIGKGHSKHNKQSSFIINTNHLESNIRSYPQTSIH